MPYTRSSQQHTSLPSAEFDALVQAHDFYQGEAAAALKTIDELRAEIERLKAPPTPVRPIITKDVIKNVMGVTLENSLTAPTDAQYEAMRVAMRQAAEMGFNAARWFLNAGEVKTHNALVDANSPDHLPNYARSLGLVYIADTVDSVVWNTFKIENDPLKSGAQKASATSALKVYLVGLERLGAAAFYLNDANQYRDAAKFPAGTLEKIAARIRSITPNMPLIASLTANAARGDYGAADHIEAQTFGTVSELKAFLGRDFDVYCLDGRAKTVHVDYLQAMKDLLAARNPEACFFYCDTVKDWQNAGMQEELVIIRDIVQAWQAKRERP